MAIRGASEFGSFSKKEDNIMARGQQDQELTQAEIKHLQAQDQALAQAAQQEAARTAIAQQEQQTRATGEARAGRESEFKMGQEREMTPFQKLLQLSQAGAPETQERMNKLRAAVDLYQTSQQGKIAREQMQSAQQIESGREQGAMARQKEVSKSNITDAMITHLATRPDIVDPTVFREALKQRGAPELADAYDKVREPMIQSQVDNLKPALQAMHKAGKLDAGLQSITDPDVRKRIQPYVDELTKTPAAQTTEERFPGYGGGASQDIKYAPIDLVNLISTVANKTVVPGLNTVYGAVGAPPVEKAPILPRDYRAAWELLNR
jgi:hypothetical protein